MGKFLPGEMYAYNGTVWRVDKVKREIGKLRLMTLDGTRVSTYTIYTDDGWEYIKPRLYSGALGHYIHITVYARR